MKENNNNNNVAQLTISAIKTALSNRAKHNKTHIFISFALNCELCVCDFCARSLCAFLSSRAPICDAACEWVFV